VERHLGNIETAWVLAGRFAPLTVAGVLRLGGAPPLERVRASLDALQQHHRLLQARITRRRGRYSFEVTADVPPIPLDVVERRDADHWREVATAVLNQRLDLETGPLLRCVYLHDDAGTDGDIVFAYDHSVLDATSAAHVYEQFLTWCQGPPPAAPSVAPPLPPPIDDLLPARLRGRARIAPKTAFLRRQVADELAFRRATRGRSDAVRPEARCHLVTRSLDSTATDELVRRARRHRLTTNSVIGAAMLVAAHRHLRGDAGRLPMRAITFADLRSDLEPPPAPDVLGCYISMMRFTVPVGPDDDLWTAAAAYQAQVRAAWEHDEHLLSATVAKQLVRMSTTIKRMRIGSTAHSYAGGLGLAERYGEIELIDVHGFISNNRVGPLVTAFVKINRGALSWDFVFLDTDFDEATAERIADTVCDGLVEAAA